MDQKILNSSEIFIEAIRVISRPLDTDMGIQSLTPFVLSISAESSNYEDLRINLYMSNSDSIPYTSELDNNWSKLKPQWRFLDSNGDYIEEQIEIDFDTEVLDENGEVRGAIGTVTFYYMDDLPNTYGCPRMIIASLDLENYYDKDYTERGFSVISHYNSQIKIVIPFYVYPIIPSFIHFSKNGKFDLYNIQWAGNNINAYATIHGFPRSKFLDYDTCAVDYPILFNVPASASDGSTNILHYTIYPLTGSEITPSGALSAEFTQYDTSNASYTGGWAEVNVTSLVETDTAILSGHVNVEYDPDYYYTDATSEFWVSNIKSNTIHKLESMYIDSALPCISGVYTSLSGYIYNNVFNTAFEVSYYDPNNYDPIINSDILSNIHELSGQSANYAMAIDGDKNIWHLDFELDTIYKRDSAGVLQFSIDLREEIPSGGLFYDDFTWYGPNSISLDSQNNAYISLFNSISAMKITSDGVIDSYFYIPAAESTGFPLSSNEIDRTANIDIEVDPSDTIFMAYTGGSYNGIVMFDSSYVDLDYLDFGNNRISDISCGSSNRIFSATENGIYYSSYTIPSFASPTAIKYVDCLDATYISMDSNNNIWFVYEGNKVGYVDGSLSIGLPITGFNFIELSGNSLTNNVIGGIACDSSGFVNVLHKYDNVIYRFLVNDFISTSGNPSIYGVKILPDDNYVIINENGQINTIDATSAQPVDSLYAFGDWTGLSWDIKFSSIALSANEEVILNGSSMPFSIASFKNEYELRRFNDSWNMKEQILSYILPNYQKQFTNLWEDLIGNIVGESSKDYQTFGRQFYEKISNFVLNHSDISLSNIDQVYSQFSILGEQYENYNFNYPADLAHWMNILSIAYKRLKGSQYQCNRNFKLPNYVDIEECEICGQIHDTNLGDLIPNPTMTIGEGVVIRDTYLTSRAFDVFYPPISGSFEQLTDYGFRGPFSKNYEVYEYIQTPSYNNQSAGFINWSDEYNAIQISGTNMNDWWRSDGYVENTLSQILFEGLGIGIDYSTDVQSALNYSVYSIGDLTSGDTSIITSGSLSSEYFIPFKNNLCSPIAGYALPFYSTNPSVTANGVVIPANSIEITAGIGTEVGYIEIVLDSTSYYAPVYTMTTSYIMPVMGESISFKNSIINPSFDLESSGFLIFEKNSDKILLPIYQPA